MSFIKLVELQVRLLPACIVQFLKISRSLGRKVIVIILPKVSRIKHKMNTWHINWHNWDAIILYKNSEEWWYQIIPYPYFVNRKHLRWEYKLITNKATFLLIEDEAITNADNSIWALLRHKIFYRKISACRNRRWWSSRYLRSISKYKIECYYYYYYSHKVDIITI